MTMHTLIPILDSCTPEEFRKALAELDAKQPKPTPKREEKGDTNEVS